MVGEVHPGVIVHEAVHFAFFVEVDAGHELPAEAGAGERRAVEHDFVRLASEHNQYFAVAVQEGIRFGNSILCCPALFGVVGVFAGGIAEFFVAAAMQWLSAFQTFSFHDANIRFYSILSDTTDKNPVIIDYFFICLISSCFCRKSGRDL